MIADTAHIRAIGNLPASITDATLNPHLWTAEERLRGWVSSSDYTEAENIAAGLGTPRNFDTGFAGETGAQIRLTRSLANAEALLALSTAMGPINTVLETAVGAAGISVSGSMDDNAYQYLSPAEVAKAEKDYLAKAEAAAHAYLVNTGGSPGPAVSPALDDEGDPI